ncbi:tetratricopeptide repeat protein, partial [Vibrio cholerae]|uniref:tetratricopeptide repeat protein n=1 Tax=Vibrio cholerae TaxID=666 RepID=UPI001F1C8CFA
LGKPMSAAPAYKRAMELDPKSAPAYYKYGELSFEMREDGDALQALERALVLDQQGRVINLARARQLASRAAEMARRER